MAHSLRSHSPVPNIRQDLKNGATFECHKNSVFRVHADILVVSRNGSVESCVREKVGYREWDKKKGYSLIVTDWKFKKISTLDSQSSFHFSKVFVVQVPVFTKYYGKKWLEEFQTMINKLLTEADKDKQTSITIPLLGTNAGGAPKDGCVERVMDAVFKFPKLKSVRKINLVVQSWSEVTQVQDLVAIEKLRQKSDDEKYNNINQNKKKQHLMSSSKNHDTATARNRAQSQDKSKLANGNRFHSLTDQNSHSNTNGGKGDNSNSRNTRTSSSSSSSSSSRPSPESDHLTSAKSRPDSARDGGGIHDIPGFGNSGSSSWRNNEEVGAVGSPVDPASYNNSTQHGNHSDKPKESYARMVTKNQKGNSDHNHISNRDSTRSNNAEDEELSPEYVAAHKNHKMDSDHRNVSGERRLHNANSSRNYPNKDVSNAEFAEFDRDRLRELEEIEEEDKRNKMADSFHEEELESRHQNGNFDSKKNNSNHQVKEYRDVSAYKCLHCKYFATIRFVLPCHHFYCDGCVPHDKVCPQCEAEEDAKFNKKQENGAEPGNRLQSSSQQTHEKDPEGRRIQRNKMVDEEETESQNENFERKKGISNHQVKDMEIEKNEASDIQTTTELKMFKCSNCKRGAYSKVRLPCSHVYCIVCAPKGQDCPQCKVIDEKSKKEVENGTEASKRIFSLSKQTHEEDPESRSIQRNKMVEPPNYTKELVSGRQIGSFDSKKRISNNHEKDMEIEKNEASDIQATTEDGKFWCKNCVHYGYDRFELSCGHVFCILCDPGVQGCPQCEAGDEKFYKEDAHEPSNRVQSSKEGIHEEGAQPSNRDQRSRKYNCKSCLGYTVKELMKLPCCHFCCVWCFVDPLNCQQCKVDDEKSNKEEENGTEASNRGQSSSKQTNGEDRTKIFGKYHCKSCFGYTFMKLLKRSCSHSCCVRCFVNHLSCQQCEAEQYNKEKENGAEASNRISSETHGEVRDQMSKKPYCNSCSSTFSELFELPCRHLCCRNCFSPLQNCQQCKAEQSNKEKKNSAEASNTVPSSKERTTGEERPSNGTLEDDPSNRVQSSKKRTNGDGQDKAVEEKCHRCDSSLKNNSPVQLGCGHLFCAKCASKGCNVPSCKEELTGNRDQVPSSRKQTNGEGRDNAMEEKCHGCDSSVANISSVQQANGHTFCSRCVSEGCNHSLCNKELKGNSSRERTDGDDPSNRVQSSSQETHGVDQDNTREDKCQRCVAKDCTNPSCNEKLKGNRDPSPSNDPSCNEDKVQSSSEVHGDVRAKTAVPTCYGCKVNLKNNSPVQLGCGHTFCARCASKGCKDPSCEEDQDYDPDDINRKESGSNQDLSDNHSNSRSDTREHDRNKRINNNSRGNLSGSDGNHRDNHSSRDRDGSDSNHRDNQSSDGNHRDRHRSRDRNRNGNDRNHRSIDRNGSGYRHSSRDRNGSSYRQGSSDRKGSGYRQGSSDRKGSSYRQGSSDRKGSGYRQGSSDRNGGNYRQGSSDRNGGNYRQGSSDRNGGNYRQGNRDRNGSYNNHSSRDRKESEGQEVMPKHGESDQSPKETCAICMDDFTNPKTLDKCGHVFCRKCIEDCFKLHKPVCPSCGTMYGVTIGNMPPGTMDVRKTPAPIEGFKIKSGSYCINYHFSDGIQRSEHPNPGSSFRGTTRTAYLPASPKGIEVCKMLKVAFKRRLTFTIGRSTTTGRDNVVTWNDIHHKTSMIGGPTQFGYPDPTYLTRVKEELASKGVTLDDINGISDRNEHLVS